MKRPRNNAIVWAKKAAKYKRCRICNKRFDDQGWVKVTMCDECYSAEPVRDEGCDNVCVNKPRSFICTKAKCACPVHSSITITELLDKGSR